MSAPVEFRRARSWASEWVTLGLLALIPLLAVLQYRWIQRLGRAEREQVQGSVNAAAARFRQEFNGELTRAIMALHMGRPAPPSREGDEAGGRIALWSATSPWRGVVVNWYRSAGGDEGTEQLFRFDAATEGFTPISWPGRLASLRDAVGRLSEREMRNQGPPLVPVILNDSAALVGARFDSPGGPMRQRGGISGWSIAELDLHYIETEMLPQLARKHFGAEYRVRVASRADPSHALYDSKPGSPLTLPDVAVGLLDIRPDQSGPGPGAGMRARRFANFAPPDREGPAPPGLPADDRSRWELLVQHVAGSVDAAVAERRHRDLVLSGGNPGAVGRQRRAARALEPPRAAHRPSSIGIRGRCLARAAHTPLGDLLGGG